MTQLQLEDADGTYQVERYNNDEIVISGQHFQQSVIVTPNKIITDWPVNNIADLTAEKLTDLIALKPAIFLLGTGETLTFPSQAIFAELYQHKIGVEVMNNGAACRTFNALAAEGRDVVVGLIF